MKIRQIDKLEKYIYSWPVAIVLFALCIGLLNPIIYWAGVLDRQSTLTKDATDERDALREKYERANERYENINTDRGMEEYIREVYPVVKNGEKVIVLTEPKQDAVMPVKSDLTLEEKIVLKIKNFLE